MSKRGELLNHPYNINSFLHPEHLQIANLDLSKGVTRLSLPN
jgi:hypothetical protein